MRSVICVTTMFAVYGETTGKSGILGIFEGVKKTTNGLTEKSNRTLRASDGSCKSRPWYRAEIFSHIKVCF